jgi:hypothetical protein
VGAKLYHVDGQTAMMKLRGLFAILRARLKVTLNNLTSQNLVISEVDFSLVLRFKRCIKEIHISLHISTFNCPLTITVNFRLTV